ncbi:MAG: cysteine desulfurase [Zoogloeaceae bacterium]|jgi:cysteine desulfurase|nr:cysteine desulfurase [Zoogloeaceae bacterium]
MSAPVYLDHNATTPVDERVLAAMLPFFSARCGNPSSRHEHGRVALAALETARQQVAAAVGAHPTEILFVSSGSEANNLFLKGAAAAYAAYGHPPGTLATSAVEHPCVRNAARQLARQGWRHLELPVDAAGRVTAAGIAAAIREAPALWSVMRANNETGVLQDVAGIARQVREALPEASFHSDAVQAFGKIPLDFRALCAAGVQALTLSAHKIYGPKGAAALVVDKRLELAPLIAGGGQERGLRSGTENVAAIVGFGLAAELAASRLANLARHLEVLRARLEAGLLAQGAMLFGGEAPRLPNTTAFAFAGIEGETLITKLDQAGFAVASGAACSSASPEVSPGLTAMGIPAALARGAVRVSLGADNTRQQIDDFLLALQETRARLRNLAPHATENATNGA